MDWIDDRNYLINNFDVIMRDINIDITLGNIKFEFNPDIDKLRKGKNFIFNKNYWPIIEKHKNNCIITGSCSLIAFGLLKRDPKDIDLILLNDNKLFTDQLSKNRYPEMESNAMYGYYRYDNFKSSYLVDFFKYDESISYVEKDGYKFENPFSILEKKMLMKRKKGSDKLKDIEDIQKCLYNLTNGSITITCR